MKIYLDEDVNPQLKPHIKHLGNIKTAQQKGWDGLLDYEAYDLAVRAGLDLIVTSNKSENSKRRDEGFLNQVLSHYGCEEKDLPVPVIELWKKGVGNDWNALIKYLPEFIEKMERYATHIGQEHERRRAEAVKKMDRLELARQQRETSRQRER